MGENLTKTDVRFAEVEFLRSINASTYEICRVLDMRLDSLLRWAERHQHEWLLSKLRPEWKKIKEEKKKQLEGVTDD